MSQTPPRPTVWFRLDQDDRIVGTGIERRGGGEDEVPALPAEQVVGTSIFDHIRGHFTRRFLDEFLRRARATGAGARQSYRCDSPEQKKLMEMRAQVEPSGTLLMEHFDLDARPMPHPIRVREAPARRAPVLRCSVCNRLRARSGGDWREPEALAPPGEETLVIHTVCPGCRAGFSARFRWRQMAAASDAGPARG